MSTAIKFHADILVETERLSYDQWLNYRRGGIGGSDIAAICGLSKWRTPIHVYAPRASLDRLNSSINWSNHCTCPPRT
ncbi:YqaJ viral recombinase family protein [Gorillibacterium sp. CAU 1737]|uniref:YqaJ viral recombinase family protein n=1 Tax=Gorillibacterium sp. CAU 1737 TaxID=3140362 RepID=UPI003260995B